MNKVKLKNFKLIFIFKNKLLILQIFIIFKKKKIILGNRWIYFMVILQTMNI